MTETPPRGALFDLGAVIVTPGVLDLAATGAFNPFTLLARHACGDWGDLADEDRQANERAWRSGDRLLSAYQVTSAVRVWIITEGTGDAGRRAATTILLPDEY